MIKHLKNTYSTTIFGKSYQSKNVLPLNQQNWTQEMYLGDAFFGLWKIWNKIPQEHPRKSFEKEKIYKAPGKSSEKGKTDQFSLNKWLITL